MKTFKDLGLAETLLRALEAEGYDTPTPIQAEVIPLLLEGRDVVGIAQTGTGKTASFVLPLMHRFGLEPQAPSARSCRALILTPTRELATQIGDEIARYSRFDKISVAVVVGGVKPGPQVRALARGVDILIATPGRLMDHMSSGALDIGKAHTVVLDEADQMLDLGFMPAIKRIMPRLPKSRQTVLMSATMPPEIRRLAAQFLKSPQEVAVAPVARPIEQITQSVIEVDAADKRAVLTRVLSEGVDRAIVFTRTKHGADKVTRHLVKSGLGATAIHGNKSQNQRERALEAFRTGDAPILVATDIAARGIHVDDVSHVINFELPHVAEVYVHRIGRTARAGRSGVAIALCDPTERKLLRAIERLTGMALARQSTGGSVGERAPSMPRAKPSQSAASGAPGEKNGPRPTDKPARRRNRNARHRSRPTQPSTTRQNGAGPSRAPVSDAS